MKKIILDTNFLISAFSYRIDLVDEIKNLVEEPSEFMILDSVIWELNKISESKAKDGKYAKVALSFLKQENVKIIQSEVRNVDDAIIKAAGNDGIVATNDIELRGKLTVLGIKTIYLRKRKYLAIG